ncbi:MAG: DNA repair protein [Lachnospiraceae bacterium]|nr:DNA repair protein [Lachnospiraceae bacterium]
MTERELKKLSRAELLEMLLALTKENRKLKEELDDAYAELEDRRILIDKAGSIAEAALQLNGVFQAAEEAAAQYLENVRRLAEESSK